MARLKRQNVIEKETRYDRLLRIRCEYQSYDKIGKQVNEERLRDEAFGLDWWLIVCDQEHFNCLKSRNLIERFSI